MPEEEIHGDAPRLTLTGTEDGAIAVDMREDTGDVILRDKANATDLVRVSADTPVVIDVPFPVLFEVGQTGLKADTTGVKYTSESIIPTISNYATLSIEATWTGSGTASVTDIELYDDNDGVVIASVSGNDGMNKKSDYVKFTAGHSLVVRVYVSTAGSSTDTVDVKKAVVYQRITLS